MADSLKLSLDLSLNDRLVGPLKRALGEVRSELGKVVNGLSKVEQVGDRAGKGLALIGSRTSVVGKAAQEAERNLRGMHSELGGLAEKSERAAGSLQKVGKEAATLRTTAKAMKEVGDAAKDAERHTERLSRMRNLTRGVAGVVAGTTAASAVIAAPARRAADYDTALRGLVTTAYGGQGEAALRAGYATMSGGITNAVRVGGGTRDQAVEALGAVLASGVVGDPSQAVGMLPSIMRATTANPGSSAVDLAGLVIASIQNYGFKPSDADRVLGMGMRSGQLGGFELKDMARHLPEQMAISSQVLGMSGETGLVKLLTMNQLARTAAGSSDAAAVNVKNLLSKANSKDTANEFKKLDIDLRGSLTAATGKGVAGTDAFINLVEQVIASNPEYARALKAGGSSGANLEAMKGIAQGAAIGSVVQDMQALLGLLPQLANRAKARDLEAQTLNSSNTAGEAFNFMKEGAGYKFDQRAFEVQQAQTQAMNSANSVITKLAEAQTDLYKKYPEFGDAVEGSTIVVKAFTAALAASGLVSLLTGGGGGLLGRGAGAAVGGAGRLVATAGGAGAVALGGAGVLAAGGAGYGVGSLISKGIEGTRAADVIGEMTAKVAAFFGSQEAQDALNTNRQAEAAQAMEAAAAALANRPPIKVMINGREITSVVDEQVEWYSRRQ